jgi:formate hydrogenlyase transcriptional activator
MLCRRDRHAPFARQIHELGVLESSGWRIRGHSSAAERLGLTPTTLETRMAKLGLRRPRAV